MLRFQSDLLVLDMASVKPDINLPVPEVLVSNHDRDNVSPRMKKRKLTETMENIGDYTQYSGMHQLEFFSYLCGLRVFIKFLLILCSDWWFASGFFVILPPPARARISEQKCNVLTASNMRQSTPYSRNTPQSFSRAMLILDF